MRLAPFQAKVVLNHKNAAVAIITLLQVMEANWRLGKSITECTHSQLQLH